MPDKNHNSPSSKSPVENCINGRLDSELDDSAANCPPIIPESNMKLDQNLNLDLPVDAMEADASVSEGGKYLLQENYCNILILNKSS